MREILFKGKRKDNSEWVEGYYASFDLSICKEVYGGPVAAIFEPMENAEVFGSYVGGLWRPVDPETVGQYVGMADKNGVKIFEGDVIKLESADNDAPESYGVVHFDETSVSWMASSGAYTFFFESYNRENIEVIGNIHDDPEPKLMEVAE